MTDTTAAAEKSPKRRRLDDEKDTARSDIKGSNSKAAGRPGLPHLPPDLWAHVMPFLPYSDNLTCSILNRSFLNDVAPRIKEIAVLNREKMRVGVPTPRFRSVERVTIACIFRNPEGYEEPDHDDDYSFEYSRLDDAKKFDHLCPEVDGVVVSRTMPFLLAFSSLAYATFGRFYMIETKFKGNAFSLISPYDGKSYPRWHSRLIEWDDPVFGMSSLMTKSDQSRRNCQLIQSLELAVAGAYTSSAFAESVYVSCLAVRCFPHLNEERNKICPHCTLCNNSLPFYKVIYAAHDRCTSADCVVNSILKRKGGREYLTSEEFILDDYVTALSYTRIIRKDWSLAEAYVRAGLSPGITRSKFVNWLTTEDRSHFLYDALIRHDLAMIGAPIHETDWKEQEV